MSRTQQNHAKALHWIVLLLRNHDVPFLICGGLAAIGYGSKRAINDIDLFVPSERFREVVYLGASYISKPAQRYCEAAEGWDLEYVQFKHSGVKIEVGNPDGAKILNSATNRWVSLELDFSSIETRSVLGIPLPLMKPEALADYKHKLGRPVDLQDIETMQP
jgi:hypothetical protein